MRSMASNQVPLQELERLCSLNCFVGPLLEGLIPKWHNPPLSHFYCSMSRTVEQPKAQNTKQTIEFKSNLAFIVCVPADGVLVLLCYARIYHFCSNSSMAILELRSSVDMFF